MPTTNELRDTLMNEGLIAEGSVSDPETDLFESGILDSLRMISLIDVLEHRFQIKIRDEDILPENFSTLSGMADYITSRQVG